MGEKVIRVTQRGQATLPKAFREELNIDAPGRVTMRATEEGILITPVPTPEELEGELCGETDDDGRSGVDLLHESRKSDVRAEDSNEWRTETRRDESGRFRC
jgi:antitoxin PrlF